MYIYISYKIYGLQPSYHLPTSRKENTGCSTRGGALGALGALGQWPGFSPHWPILMIMNEDDSNDDSDDSKDHLWLSSSLY